MDVPLANNAPAAPAVVSLRNCLATTLPPDFLSSDRSAELEVAVVVGVEDTVVFEGAVEVEEEEDDDDLAEEVVEEVLFPADFWLDTDETEVAPVADRGGSAGGTFSDEEAEVDCFRLMLEVDPLAEEGDLLLVLVRALPFLLHNLPLPTPLFSK